MIYEVEVRQTTAGRILIKANSLEEADMSRDLSTILGSIHEKPELLEEK